LFFAKHECHFRFRSETRFEIVIPGWPETTRPEISRVRVFARAPG
jgi:hypothetical protein